jgi:RNA polymerase sigma-70 factor (ECF subfamily)
MTPSPGTGEGLKAPAPGAPPEPAPADAEDVAWIRDFQSGREQGFNRLVLKHKDRVYGLCLRLLSGDAEEAEDAAQEAFVRGYKGLKDFRLEAKFSSWMYRIAVNVCKNKMASRSWRETRRNVSLEAADTAPAVDASGASDGAYAFGSQAPSPAQELDAKKRRIRIESAIARLPDEQRELVVLRDVEGRSYEEIAEATGLNAGTVKSRLNRGRGQLREWLRDCLLLLLFVALPWMVNDHG